MSTTQSLTILDKLRTRGHWLVTIRPATFREARVPCGDLFPIVEKSSVRLRGWDYPHVDRGSEPIREADSVGQDCDRDDTVEFWRFYTRGQFAHRFGMSGDWRDRSNFWPADEDWQPLRDLWYLDAIDTFPEIFEFAARLALSEAGDARMHVEIKIRHLKGRRLVSELEGIFRSSDNYVTQADEWENHWEGSQVELIARPRELAAERAQDLFDRFGGDVSLETLARLQEGIGR